LTTTRDAPPPHPPTRRFLSCADILRAFISGIHPALTRASYTDALTREQRMEELDAVAEDFLASPLSAIRTSPDGKLVYRGHGDDATLLDVVSHGFFHPQRGSVSSSSGSGVTGTGSIPGVGGKLRREGEAARVVPRVHPGATHATLVEPPPPLTVDQRDARLETLCELKPGGVAPTDHAAAAAIETEAFTHTMGVCHRLAVFETDEARDAMRVVAIFSQLDMIRFLSRRVDAIGTLADATLSQLGLVSRKHNGVVTAPWDRPALECFKLMRDRDVSAVGVVDQTGELVANLSASDLRRLDARSFRLLALPVAEFISRRKGDAIGRRGAPFAEARRIDAAEANGRERRDDTRATRDPEVDIDRGRDVDARARDSATVSAAVSARRARETDEATRSADVEPRPGDASGLDFPAPSRTFVELIFARADTTLRRVLRLMTTHGIHHVYVVDDDDRPAAVVTPTDVLRLLVVEDEDSAWNVVWSQHQQPAQEEMERWTGEDRETRKAGARTRAYQGAEGVVV
jgi:CBS domain-containing protein